MNTYFAAVSDPADDEAEETVIILRVLYDSQSIDDKPQGKV